MNTRRSVRSRQRGWTLIGGLVFGIAIWAVGIGLAVLETGTPVDPDSAIPTGSAKW